MEKRDYSNLPEHLPHGKLAFNDSTNELFIGAGENAPLQKVTNKEIEDELRVASIDYSGEHHANLKDSMDANVDFVMGEFNSVQMTGEYITAQNTIPRHVKRAELKGHTEVNLIQEPSGEDVVLPYSFEGGEYVTINDTHSNGRVEVEVKGRTLVNLSSPHEEREVEFTYRWQTYDVINDKSVGGLNEGELIYMSMEINIHEINIDTLDFRIMSSRNNGGYAILVKSFDELKAMPKNEWIKVSTIRTVNAEHSLDQYSLQCGILGEHPTESGEQVARVSFRKPMWVNLTKMFGKGKEPTLSECDSIPYFEGMASVQTPTVKTVGKNLWDNRVFENCPIATINNDGSITLNGTLSTHWMFNYTIDKGTYISSAIGNDDGHIHLFWGGGDEFFQRTSPITISEKVTRQGYITRGVYENINVKLQLEEGSQATTYEHYQSSLLTLPEEVVLRGLPNGVCDTYNTKTKEYTQRIGEVVLDGSEGRRWHKESTQGGSGDTDTTSCYYTTIQDLVRKRYPPIFCDKLPVYEKVMYHKENDHEGLGSNLGDGRIFIRINQSRLEENSANGFKKWLSQRPITINYPLITPIITKIDLPSLKAYNTVTHLSSTVGDGSLVPTLASDNTISYPAILKPNTKYSVITNPTLNGHTSTPISCNLGGASIEILPDSGNCHLITTPSNLAHSNLTFTDGDGHKLCGGVMLLEGDKTGMMFNYFEGMKSVENPIVRVNNKNLISKCDYSKQSQLGFDTGYAYKKFPWIQLKPMTEYKLILHDLSVPAYNWNVLDIENLYSTMTPIYNINRWDDSSPSEIITKIIHLRTTPTGKIRFSNYIVGTKDNRDDNYDCLFGNLCSAITLWEKDSDDSFILKQSNTLTIPTQLSLRSLPNGVCDTLDLITGEYAQNVEEIVLDGSEGWKVWISGEPVLSSRKTIGFAICLKNAPDDRNFRINCANFKEASSNRDEHPYYSSNLEGIGGYYANPTTKQMLAVSILKTRLGMSEDSSDANQMVHRFKEWLSENPIPVQYELAEPITTKLDLQWEDDKLFAYDGTTHFLVDTEGSHLYPVFDVDVPVNLSAEFSRLRAEKEQLQRDKDRLENQLSLVTYHKDTLYSNVQSLQTENSQLKTKAEDLQVKSNVLELKSGELEKCTTRLTQSTAHLSEGLQFVDSTREKGDLELLSSDFDLDFRLMEIEFALDLTLPAQFRTKEVRNMARTPYEMAKTLILGGKYDREDMEFKLGRYLKRGQITQEQHDELLALMEANDMM